MSYISLINKYKPNKLDDFLINDLTKEIINKYIESNSFKFLIIGNSCSGKTSLIDVILKIYYGENNVNDNIIKINLLKEQGISYFRNDLKTFCSINNLNKKMKKTIVIDDLDLLNDQYQQIISNYICNYKNINFILSFTDLQKVNEILLNKLEIIELNIIDSNFINKLYNKIVKEENINLDDKCKELIIISSNNCIANLINIFEKLLIINKDINFNYLNDIIFNIKMDDLDKYINYCKNKDIKSASSILFKIYNNGYTVIDILDALFLYIKNISKLNEDKKYEIIKYICKYTNIFNSLHEESIELYFLTNNITSIF